MRYRTGEFLLCGVAVYKIWGGQDKIRFGKEVIDEIRYDLDACGICILFGRNASHRCRIYEENKKLRGLFLGGRGLNGWVAALSAQASDMSGWMLMGLPGAVYAFGTGQIWIAVGLLIGTILNWAIVSGRLRRYTIRANNSMTLPKYLENRFEDKHKIMLLVSSVAIVIFFLVYTASALSAGGKLFNSIFGIDYKICLTIGAVVILGYTFMGGFMAVCVTDFVQGLLMLAGVVTIPIIAFSLLEQETLWTTSPQAVLRHIIILTYSMMKRVRPFQPST